MTCHTHDMMWWLVVLSVTSDDLAFLDGCWERFDRGVERVRWTRDRDVWTGQYEQNGPKTDHVAATLTIRESGRGLEVATTDRVCDWDTCMAPFVVEGVIDRTRTRHLVLGRGDTALWLGYDRRRDELLFGQGEANAFTRCED